MAQFMYRTISHCYIPNIKAVGLVVSENKIFEFFSYCRSMETIDPWGVAKEGRALTGFSGPPKSQKIKVSVQHFILYVLIDERSKCFNLILI